MYKNDSPFNSHKRNKLTLYTCLFGFGIWILHKKSNVDYIVHDHLLIKNHKTQKKVVRNILPTCKMLYMHKKFSETISSTKSNLLNKYLAPTFTRKWEVLV